MRISVHYPDARGRLVLRTAHDWDRDVLPVEEHDHAAVFDVDIPSPNLALKPCLRDDGALRWATGENVVLGAWEPDPRIWPVFHAPPRGRVTGEEHHDWEGARYDVRVYLPPGYDENTCRHAPVLYMQDGDNLFFPENAFGGREWRVDETMDRLGTMHAIQRTIVVGVAPHDRMRDYTSPGYHAYGRFLAEHLKPNVDRTYRTRPGAGDTAVMGSSLGGVASLHVALAHPDRFGNAACLSSTFGYRDDLFERVAALSRPTARVWLDSGWPRDNYDATNAMRDLMVARGWRIGHDLMQFSFPEGLHDEPSWAARIHLPFQFFFGRAWAAGRAHRAAPA